MKTFRLIKNSFLIVALVLVMGGCSKKNVLEGNWNTVALVKDGIAQTICKSNISFSESGVYYDSKGLAGMNLFNVYVKDNKKSIETFGMVNTGFRGSAEVMEYEDMFFDAFLNSDSYKIKDDILYFYNHEKKLELQLRKSRE